MSFIVRDGSEILVERMGNTNPPKSTGSQNKLSTNRRGFRLPICSSHSTLRQWCKGFLRISRSLWSAPISSHLHLALLKQSQFGYKLIHCGLQHESDLYKAHVQEAARAREQIFITLCNCSSPYLTIPDSWSHKSLQVAFPRLFQCKGKLWVVSSKWNSHSLLRFQNNQQITQEDSALGLCLKPTAIV